MITEPPLILNMLSNLYIIDWLLSCGFCKLKILMQRL